MFLQATSQKRSSGSPSSSRSIMTNKRQRFSRPNPSMFEQRQKTRRAFEFQELNKEYQKHLKELKLPADGEDDDVDLNDTSLKQLELIQGAYKMHAREINLRFGGGALGYIVSFGQTDSGQLGRPTQDEFAPTPSVLKNTKAEHKLFHSIVSSADANVALGTDGIPYCFGLADDHALGREIPNDQGFPEPLNGFVSIHGENEDGTITQAAVGGTFTLFLTEKGNVYSCGMYKEESAMFCMPSRESKKKCRGYNKTPHHIWSIEQKVIMIWAQGCHAAALLDDHSTLLTWGIAEVGENGNTESLAMEVTAEKIYRVPPEVIRSSDGSLLDDKVAEIYLTPKPVLWPNFGSLKKTILAVGCGDTHLLVLSREPNSAETNVFSTGQNDFGELGHGDTKNRHKLTLIKELEGKNIAQLAAGKNFSMAMDITGKRIYTWGKSDGGRLGRGPPVITETEYGTSAPENVLKPQLLPFPVDKPLVFNKIGVGEQAGYAITVTNELYSWGYEYTTGHDVVVDVPRPRKVDFPTYLEKEYVDVYDVNGGANHGVALVAWDKPAQKKDDDGAMEE